MEASFNGAGAGNFADNTQVSGGATGNGRTFIDTTFTNRIMQHGTITRISYLAHEADAAGMRVGVFRPNGSAWDNVGWSELIDTVAGVPTSVDLTTPIAGVQPGDVLAYWIAGSEVTSGSIGAVMTGGGGLKWDDGLITGTAHTFGHTIAGDALPLEAFGLGPWVVLFGDSLPSGHGGGSPWVEYFDVTNALSGDVSRELGFRLRALRGTDFTYQALCSGSKTVADVLSQQVPALISGTSMHESELLHPLAVVMNGGVNDVATGRDWTDIQPDLDDIVTALGSTPLVLMNIAPASTLDDTEAATVRDINSNLVTWAAGKPTVHLVDVWSLLGSLRVSTGFNDDLASVNDVGDGIHWSLAGVTTVATAVSAALSALFD